MRLNLQRTQIVPYLSPFFVLLILLWYVPPSFYWRDGPEFVLTAFFSDVPHPAGFPLYIQLSNIFALIPFGPIAWRVNMFSLVCMSLAVFLLMAFLFSLILKNSEKIKIINSLFIMAFVIISLFSTGAVLRQSITPEVYVLNALLILTVVFFCIKWKERRDFRYLLSAAFLSGLTMGNHVASVIPLVLIAITFLVKFPELRRKTVQLIFMTLVGGLIYLSLPLRANNQLPLNTGAINTSKNFWQHISDRRDSVLRQNEEGKKLDTQFPLPILAKDLNEIVKQQGIILVFALFGLILVWKRDRIIALLFCLTAIGNNLFFKGWSADPWIISFLVTVFFATYFMLWLNLYLTSPKREILTGLILVIVLLVQPLKLNEIELGSYNLPEQKTKSQIELLKKESFYLVEPGWFSLRALTTIYGYRSDLVLAYLPGIMFPEYFSEQEIIIEDTKKFDLTNLESQHKLGALVKQVAQLSSFYFEPSYYTSTFFKDVVQLDSEGVPKLVIGKKRMIDIKVVNELIGAERLKLNKSSLFNEDENYELDLELFQLTRLLNEAGLIEKSISILKNQCLELENRKCGVILLNNLSAYALLTKDYRLAIESAELAISRTMFPPLGLKKNLKMAFSHLKEDSKL